MKLRYSIGIATKMIFIVTFIVISAIGVVVYIATDLFHEDSVTKVQETNKDTAVQLAERVHSVFQDATEKMALMAQFATRSQSVDEAKRAIQNTLTSSDEIISFVAHRFNDKGDPEEVFFVASESALAEFSLDQKKLETAVHNDVLAQQIAKPSEVILLNSSPVYGVPLFTLSFLSQAKTEVSTTTTSLAPAVAATGTAGAPSGTTTASAFPAPTKSPLSGRWWFRAEIRQDRILKLFASKKFVTSYLVDAKGHLMAHSDPEMTKLVIQGKNFATNPIVQKMLEGGQDNHQMRYDDESGQAFLGAFKKVGVAGIGVVAEVSEAKALATIERVQYRSFLVMIVVVCIAFFFNFGFSKSLTSNLKKLFQATEQIVEGKFDVDLKVKSSDEIGALAHAFLNMTEGLKERDKIKDAFDKFHSKEIAKKLLSGEIKLGGERKHATVFFSDIRGFTAMSEKMSPDQVVTMLNEYFTNMVKIIYHWQGVVDKYIGDAILAVWGVPESQGHDALHAVRACLEMRELVVDFNKARVAKGQHEIKFGIGLHSGDVLAGNIGAYDRKLEYTVIGDTVNQASRIEGACKAVGADILISDATYALVRDHGIVAGPPIKIKAKGKTNALVVHQVIGVEENGHLKTSLTQEQIEAIRNRPTEVEGEEEEKVQVAGKKVGHPNIPQMPPPIPADITNVGKMAFYDATSAGMDMSNEQMQEVCWYVVNDPGSKEYQGPFSLAQISAKLSSGQLNFNTAYAFKMGDSQMTPLNQISELDRRSAKRPDITVDLPETVIRNNALSHEWYIAGPQNQTLGPYTEDELRIALGKGNVTRDTWVWRTGLAQWIHLYEIPGFDRRGAA